MTDHHSSARDEGEVEISVVVPTHDRAHLLGRLIAAMEQQLNAPPFELVIVDDRSTDDTWYRLQELAETSAVPLRAFRLDRNRGPASARNVGWRAATGRLILFTDDDCTPEPGWVAAMSAALRDTELVQGLTRADPGQTHLSGAFSRTIEVTAASDRYQTCNVGYRRAVLERLDGFDEEFRYPAGEDTDLACRALRLGTTSRFEPAATVLHDVRPSSFVIHVRTTWRWSGIVLLVKRHPELRSQMYRRWFWKRSHPPVLLAAGGIVLALVAQHPALKLAGGVAALPYVRFRRRIWPLPGGGLQRTGALPLAFTADLAEVAVMIAASVRFRTLLI